MVYNFVALHFLVVVIDLLLIFLLLLFYSGCVLLLFIILIIIINFIIFIFHSIPLQSYAMRQIPRGLALVINVDEVEGKPPRKGTNFDRDNLCNLLTQLHFNIVVYNDSDGLSAQVWRPANHPIKSGIIQHLCDNPGILDWSKKLLNL